MKLLNLLFCLCLSVAGFAQTNTAIAKVNGNCNMCKKTIEKAGNIDGVESIVWDKDSKEATIVYDAGQVTTSDVLQAIADAGYDNELFKASDEAYSGLNNCCQYNRDGFESSAMMPHKTCAKGSGKCMKDANGKCMKDANGKCMKDADGKCMKNAEGKCMKGADGKCMKDANGKCMKGADGKKCSKMSGDDGHKCTAECKEKCMKMQEGEEKHTCTAACNHAM